MVIEQLVLRGSSKGSVASEGKMAPVAGAEQEDYFAFAAFSAMARCSPATLATC